MRWLLLGLLACFLIALVIGLAMPNRSKRVLRSYSLEEADAYFEAENWPGAALAYESVTQANPRNTHAWQRWADALVRMECYREAIPIYERVAGGMTHRDDAHWAIARAAARINEPDRALMAIEALLNANALTLEQFDNTPELDPLRDRPAFQKCRERLVERARQIEQTPLARQLDFWIGDWDIFDPQNGLIGTVSVTAQENGRIIHEHFQSNQFGQSARSTSYVDFRNDAWKMLWLDVSTQVELQGQFDGLAMRWRGEVYHDDGTTIRTIRTLKPLDDGLILHTIDHYQPSQDAWEQYLTWIYAPTDEGWDRRSIAERFGVILQNVADPIAYLDASSQSGDEVASLPDVPIRVSGASAESASPTDSPASRSAAPR